MEDKIEEYFGVRFTQAQRHLSYDFLEKFIEDNVDNWDNPPDTDDVSAKFSVAIAALDKPSFAFLLCHAGYIPEFYPHDSSQETLYTKLIEVLVNQWALRLGFKDSKIQKQKSSREDVTIQYDDTIIVCDAKSYRLGRSQGAPNVKDVIKKADYAKWKKNYLDEPGSNYSLPAGMITFPSLHKWGKSSDAYLYATDKDDPIIILFYEYMAYMYLVDDTYQQILDMIDNYENLFPNADRSQQDYLDTISGFLFDGRTEELNGFLELFNDIIKEKVQHTRDQIDAHLESEKARIRAEINAIPENELRERLIESRFHRSCNQLMKQVININKFRT